MQTPGKKIIMKCHKLFAAAILILCALGTTPIFAQGGEAEKNLPVFPVTTPQLYNAFLISVPDITGGDHGGIPPETAPLCERRLQQ